MKIKALPRICIAFVACTLLLPASSFAESDKETAHELTAMLRAYRQVIATNKASIQKPKEFFSDPKKVAKFYKQAKTFYKVFTKRPYPTTYEGQSGEYRKAFEAAVKMVIENVASGQYELKWEGDNAYVKKWDGKFLPARFAAMVSDEFNRLTNGEVSIKLTTSKQLLVNNNNAPDEWESGIIDGKMMSMNKAKNDTFSNDSADAFRFMLPEFYATGCIQCHGSGRGQEGPDIHPTNIVRKTGDFAGAISVTLRKKKA